MRVIILGTSHKYQLLNGDDSPSQFREVITAMVSRYGARAIAEEMSVEGLAQKHVARSVCAAVASDLGIPHRYCDPDNEQRGALGIRGEQDIRLASFFNDSPQDEIEREIEASHAARERFWKDQIIELNHWPVIFVCGTNHAARFRRLLEANQICAEIADDDWVPS